MKKNISHDLTPADIRKVIDKAAATYSLEYRSCNPTFKWTSDTTAQLTLRVLNKTIEANITLQSQEVLVDLQVPPAFKLFEAKASAAIDLEIKQWLKKAKAGKI